MDVRQSKTDTRVYPELTRVKELNRKQDVRRLDCLSRYTTSCTTATDAHVHVRTRTRASRLRSDCKREPYEIPFAQGRVRRTSPPSTPSPAPRRTGSSDTRTARTRGVASWTLQQLHRGQVVVHRQEAQCLSPVHWPVPVRPCVHGGVPRTPPPGLDDQWASSEEDPGPKSRNGDVRTSTIQG